MMRSLSPHLVSLGIGLLLGLILLELSLRLFTPVLASVFPGALALRLPRPYNTAGIDDLATGRSVLRYDPDLGWATTPNYRVEGQRWSQRHNHAGLRADREYAPTPPAAVRRFAAYGDSSTYCSEVNLEECWTQRLEEMLSHAEVLNFGVPAYGPDQAWLRYRRDGVGWKPCAVLIGLTVENINRVVNRFRPFLVAGEGSLPKPRFIRRGERLELLPNPVRRPDDLKDPAWVEANLGPHDDWYFPGLLGGDPLDRLALIRFVRATYYQLRRHSLASMYRPGSEALDVLTAVLVGFAEDVRTRGAAAIVLVLPLEGEIAAQRDGRAKIHASLLERLGQRGIPAIDLVDDLGAHARSVSLGDLVKGHLRPLGNAIVARTLAATLPRLTAHTCPGS